MSNYFVIDMLPGFEGDCFWIEYGNPDRPFRILVDGGRGAQSYKVVKSRLKDLPNENRRIDLIINTHVDADHIEGLYRLAEDEEVDVKIGDFWFNSYVHLSRPTGIEEYGSKQGERLGNAIVKRKWPWNKAFDLKSVVIPDDGELPVISLPGDMEAILLSPDWDGLESFIPKWEKELKEASMLPGESAPVPIDDDIEVYGGSITVTKVRQLAQSYFKMDTSEANGSSLAVLLRYSGKTLLLAGDAFDDRLINSLKSLSPDNPLKVDAFKISHHGSKGALSNDQLACVDCRTYLIASNGSRHEHPNPEVIARIVVANDEPVKFVANYNSPQMQIWNNSRLRTKFNFHISFPKLRDGLIRYDIIKDDVIQISK